MLRMGWSDWVQGQQPLVRCECFLFVGPTHLKEAPSPRPQPSPLGQVSVAILRTFSPHLCRSDRQLTSKTPGPASPSVCPHEPPGSVKSPALHFLTQLESLEPKNVGELLFPECQNVLKKRFNLIKNSNIVFTLFKIAKCLKMPEE